MMQRRRMGGDGIQPLPFLPAAKKGSQILDAAEILLPVLGGGHQHPVLAGQMGQKIALVQVGGLQQVFPPFFLVLAGGRLAQQPLKFPYVQIDAPRADKGVPLVVGLHRHLRRQTHLGQQPPQIGQGDLQIVYRVGGGIAGKQGVQQAVPQNALLAPVQQQLQSLHGLGAVIVFQPDGLAIVIDGKLAQHIHTHHFG